jgi:hypothetical protein
LSKHGHASFWRFPAGGWSRLSGEGCAHGLPALDTRRYNLSWSGLVWSCNLCYAIPIPTHASHSPCLPYPLIIPHLPPPPTHNLPLSARLCSPSPSPSLSSLLLSSFPFPSLPFPLTSHRQPILNTLAPASKTHLHPHPCPLPPHPSQSSPGPLPPEQTCPVGLFSLPALPALPPVPS